MVKCLAKLYQKVKSDIDDIIVISWQRFTWSLVSRFGSSKEFLPLNLHPFQIQSILISALSLPCSTRSLSYYHPTLICLPCWVTWLAGWSSIVTTMRPQQPPCSYCMAGSTGEFTSAARANICIFPITFSVVCSAFHASACLLASWYHSQVTPDSHFWCLSPRQPLRSNFRAENSNCSDFLTRLAGKITGMEW